MARWPDPRRSEGVVATLRHRRALIRTAVNAAAAGWPVVPGAWWSGAERRFVCDQLACTRTGPHPAVPAGGEPAGAIAGVPALAPHALRHPEAVTRQWRRRPYAVVVPTGETCDVVDVPAGVGRQLATRLDVRSCLGPVIATASRWLLLTAPGPPLHMPLTGDVLVHGTGSWIMLPPSLGAGGEPAMWLARPRGTGWALPDRDVVLQVLERSTSTPGHHRAAAAV